MDLVIANIIQEIYSPEQCTIIGINESFNDIKEKIKVLIQKFIDMIKNLFDKFISKVKQNKEEDKSIIDNKEDIVNKADENKEITLDVFEYTGIDKINISTEYMSKCTTDLYMKIDNIFKRSDTLEDLKKERNEFYNEVLTPILEDPAKIVKEITGINLPYNTEVSDIKNYMLDEFRGSTSPKEKKFTKKDLNDAIAKLSEIGKLEHDLIVKEETFKYINDTFIQVILSHIDNIKHYIDKIDLGRETEEDNPVNSDIYYIKKTGKVNERYAEFSKWSNITERYCSFILGIYTNIFAAKLEALEEYYNINKQVVKAFK